MVAVSLMAVTYEARSKHLSFSEGGVEGSEGSKPPRRPLRVEEEEQ